jgi:7,8-dihydroneopterin aldolase/epimerase/oxygenase
LLTLLLGDKARLHMDLIRIDGLELRCIVGLRSYERHREQPLRADIAMGLDLSTAGRSGRIADSADYGKAADAVAALLRFREYQLLEVAAEETAAWLFAAYPVVKLVRLRLDKPEALAGRARSAAVEIERTRGAFGTVEEPTPFGSRTEILRTSEATMELLRVRPGQSVTLDDPAPRLEWFVSGRPAHEAPDGRSPVAAGARQVLEVAAESTEPLLLARCLRMARAER